MTKQEEIIRLVECTINVHHNDIGEIGCPEWRRMMQHLPDEAMLEFIKAMDVDLEEYM